MNRSTRTEILTRASTFRVLLWIVLLLGLATVPFSLFYPDHPIPGHTGGFGEPTCHSCHFDNEVNDPSGRFLIRGLPEVILAGVTYRLVVQIDHPGMAAAGFQLTARTAAGKQSGTFEAPGDRAAVSGMEGKSVQYVHQTAVGSELVSGKAFWEIRWTAPETGSVFFHAAGNAANGDRSEFGDFIFTLSENRRVE